MISVKNLSFSYNENAEVLSNISFELDSRATAIIGQNGAGKTTLVKLLKGLLKPTNGDIYIDGQNIAETTAAKLAGTIGLVFQNPNDQIFKKSIIEEAMFGSLNLHFGRKEAHKRAFDALAMVGLTEDLEMNPQDLNLCAKKLLCIASIIAMDTSIIILDEPTIAQDYLGKEKIAEIIRILKSQNKLVMTIIHDMDFVSENFERTIVLNQGQLLLDDETKNVFANLKILSEAHVEPPYVEQLANKIGIEETCLNDDDFIKAWQYKNKF